MLRTLTSIVTEFPKRTTAKAAIKFKRDHKWQEWSWQDYFQEIETVALGLAKLGVKQGSTVAIMSNTRPEWSTTDLAVLGLGAIVVPIYQNNTADDVEYILNNSETTVLFIEGKELIPTWLNIKDKCSKISQVIVFDSFAKTEGLLAWNELKELGRVFKAEKADYFVNQCLKVNLEDTATLLYTSGTTGRPKGVVLTHTQLVSEVGEAFPIFGANVEDTSLSFLPYAHVLGRIEHWGHAYIGFTLAFAESIEKVKANLAEIQPTFIISVPRIFEKVYGAIWAQITTQPLKRKIFEWALSIGQEVAELRMTGQVIPLDLLAKHEVAKRVALNKIPLALGGRLRFAVSGGAPLAKEISSFFHATGVLILEGYGLTETTAAITVNTPFNYKFGSVGRPIGDVELKIAEDGEILVRSKKIMKEYFKNPTATKEVFTDGWFHTGDIGEIGTGGDLKITDRKKDLIKTAGGKYVAPQRLENLLKLNPLISQVLIHGDQKKYVVALITLDKLQVEEIAKSKKLDYKDWTELTQNSTVQEVVRQIVAETNAKLASFETIKRFHVLPLEFTVEGGELTPSMKVKRKALDQRFSKEIEALYH